MKAGHWQPQSLKLFKMAKRKQKPPPEPVIQHGVPLPLSYPEIPDSWMPEDDFSSHRPMLYRAIMNVAHSAFIEFGTGFGSTPLLKKTYSSHFSDKDYISYENNHEWFTNMKSSDYQLLPFTSEPAFYSGKHAMFYVRNLLEPNIWKGSILFVDCAPGELRKHLISKHSNIAKLIIVHDTEPGAEYVYGMADILGSFKYRCDLIVDGNPQTTVVSNLYEFDNWKTIVNDQIRFV
jgi:hypothetical protein